MNRCDGINLAILLVLSLKPPKEWSPELIDVESQQKSNEPWRQKGRKPWRQRR